jgi:hypothetical protein
MRNVRAEAEIASFHIYQYDKFQVYDDSKCMQLSINHRTLAT